MLRIDWNMLITIFNLIVLYLLMRHFLIKPVTDIIEKRKAAIEGRLAEASAAQAGADELKKRYEERLKESFEESARILDQTRSDARVEYDRILKEANEQASKVLENARKMAETEREKILLDAQSQIGGLVMAATAKIIAGNSNHNTDWLLYEQFLSKAGDLNESNLG